MAGVHPSYKRREIAHPTVSKTAVPLQAPEARKTCSKKPVQTAAVLKTQPEALLNWQKVTKYLAGLLCPTPSIRLRSCH